MELPWPAAPTIRTGDNGKPMGTEALRFLLMFFARWVHQRQLKVIDYLKEENQVLRAQLGDRRLRLTSEQRAPIGG